MSYERIVNVLVARLPSVGNRYKIQLGSTLLCLTHVSRLHWL